MVLFLPYLRSLPLALRASLACPEVGGNTWFPLRPVADVLEKESPVAWTPWTDGGAEFRASLLMCPSVAVRDDCSVDAEFLEAGATPLPDDPSRPEDLGGTEWLCPDLSLEPAEWVEAPASIIDERVRLVRLVRLAMLVIGSIEASPSNDRGVVSLEVNSPPLSHRRLFILGPQGRRGG